MNKDHSLSLFPAKRGVWIIAVISVLVLISCTSAKTPTGDFASDIACASASKDFSFTISNAGKAPLALSNPEAKDGVSVEVNGLELSGLMNYCGRQKLEPNEVVRCRRPGTSKNDAGFKLETGRKLLLFRAQNTVRVKAGGATKEVHVSCR